MLLRSKENKKKLILALKANTNSVASQNCTFFLSLATVYPSQAQEVFGYKRLRMFTIQVYSLAFVTKTMLAWFAIGLIFILPSSYAQTSTKFGKFILIL